MKHSNHINMVVRKALFARQIKSSLAASNAGDGLLTFMPSHRDTARSGLRALSVRIDLNAGMSAAPTIMAPKFINDSLRFEIF